MAYLFGWQAADLGVTSNTSPAGNNVIRSFGPGGGFTVPSDCTVENIWIGTRQSGRAFKLYLYDASTNALLAQSAEQTSGDTGQFVPIPPTALTSGQTVRIAWHSPTFISAVREDAIAITAFNETRDYSLGPSNPYTSGSSTNLGRLELWADGTTGSVTPTITNIDTDNAVNQYQQSAVIALDGFTESITSVTLNGVTAPIQSQVVGTSVTVNLPGSLATGTYDLVVSGATETDTLTGVSYTQTHARPAFDGLVDSNSILSGQSYTANTYFRFVTSFSNGTLDTAAGDAAEWAGDIADYYTPNAGFTGDDTGSIEFLYSDGTTSATVGVTITVSADSPEPPADDWPFGKGINSTATKNWEWGKRHPKTGMRVRVYK